MVPWMETGQLMAVAQHAEELGFEGVMGADHALFPKVLNSAYPYTPDGECPITAEMPYPDPWVSIAAMAAVTSTLKFSTSIYVLPLRNPIEVAKATATLAIMSNNRFILGAGIGWMKEEFDAYGVDFSTRGKRMDETIAALRELWAGGWAQYQGEIIQFDSIKLSPPPEQAPPLFIGGSSLAALRRAARVGDGWIGHGNMPEEVPPLLNKLTELRKEYGREQEPFETVVGLYSPPDPDVFLRLEALGMTASVNLPFRFTLGDSSTLDAKKRQMDQFAEQVMVKMQACAPR